MNKLNELKALSERQEQMKKDVVTFQGQIKVRVDWSANRKREI